MVYLTTHFRPGRIQKMRHYFESHKIDSKMYEFNLTPNSRKEIDKLFAEYINPDDTEIDIDEIEIDKSFIGIVVDSGVLAVKYTIENGEVVADMNQKFQGNILVENLTNSTILEELKQYVVERINLNGGKRKSNIRRKTRKSKRRSTKKRV